MGAISAVWELTRDSEWRSKYEITIYQLGFRLGGKGASGRNLAMCDRVEEHGPYRLWGFYDNTARVLRECYAELIERGLRQPTDPLGTLKTPSCRPSNSVRTQPHCRINIAYISLLPKRHAWTRL